MDLINVEATERTEHMMTNFEPSSNVVITFDLTGIGLAMGSGPILTITLQSNSIYTNSINLSFSDYFVSAKYFGSHEPNFQNSVSRNNKKT